MDPRGHPLRRHYALELLLGIGVALLASWVLLGSDRAARGRTVPDEPVGGAAAAPRPAALRQAARAEPEPPRGAREQAREEAPATASAAEPAEPSAGVPPEATREDVLHVRVLDASGAPAPLVPLDLALETEPFSSGPGHPPRLTDERGRTTVPLAWFAVPTWPVERYGYVLRARVPLAAAPAIDFGPTAPGPGLVTLLLPPAGRVRVRVNGRDGLPIESGASVYASVPSASGRSLTTSAEVRDGLAELPWIELGARLELKASFHDQRAPSARNTVQGPTQDGETVECELVLGAEWPLLTFRVLDEHGRALPHANLRLCVSQPPLSPQQGPCLADAEGRAELRLYGRHRSERARSLELELEGPPLRWAEVLLPLELEHGRATELGDVVLRPR